MKKFLAVLGFVIIFASYMATVLASSNYVGNANSHKFHYADCNAAGRMKEGNKVYFDTREEAIDKGYTPCKICSP